MIWLCSQVNSCWPDCKLYLWLRQTEQHRGMQDILVCIRPVATSMQCSLRLTSNPPQTGGTRHGQEPLPLKEGVFSWTLETSGRQRLCDVAAFGSYFQCCKVLLNKALTIFPKWRYSNWAGLSQAPFGKQNKASGCVCVNWINITTSCQGLVLGCHHVLYQAWVWLREVPTCLCIPVPMMQVLLGL